MMKGKSQLGAGVILSYLSQALQILTTLFYTPVMLRLLGQSEYGLYQLVYSIVSYLSLMTFGFSSAYIKFYAIAKADKNPNDEVAKINGMFLTVFCCLGLLVFVLGTVLFFNTETVLGSKLTSSELTTGQILMGIMVVNCALQFPLIVFNNYIIANEQFICLQTLNLISIIMNPCMTFPMLLMGFKSVALALVMLFITIFKFSVSIIYCLKKLNIQFRFKGVKLTLFKDVGKFSFFIFLENLVSMINVSLDRFLLGRMVGSVSVAVYAVGGQINTLYTTLSTSISSVFTPRINTMIAAGNRDHELSDLFINVGRIQFSVLYLVLLGFTVFGKRFIALWAGDGYENAFYVAMVLIWPNTIELIQNIAIEIQRAKGLQKYRSLLYTIMAVTNIVISIILITKLQEVGAAIGTGMVWIFGSGLLMNFYYWKKVGLKIKRFWVEILRMSLFGIILLVPGFYFQSYIQSCSLIRYVVLIVAFALVYLTLLLCLGIRKTERKQIFLYANKLLRK